MALPNGAGGYQVGDGNLNEVILGVQVAPNTYTGAATLTVTDLENDLDAVGSVWRIPYEQRARQARDWSRLHGLQPASADTSKTWLMLIDVQNTFCIPDFELYVGRAQWTRCCGG